MDLHKALKELAEMIKAEIIRRVWEEGVNPKTGTNTLITSDLIKNMKVEAVSENKIVFIIADYYEFVVNGWKRTHDWGGGMAPFINNLVEWIRKKNVHQVGITDNQLAWAIAKKIFEGGIAPRPFINSGYNNDEDPSKVLPFLDEYFDEWSDKVFDKITEELDKYFNE